MHTSLVVSRALFVHIFPNYQQRPFSCPSLFRMLRRAALVLIASLPAGQAGFLGGHQQQYLDLFDDMIKNSTAADLPMALASQCQHQGPGPVTAAVETVSESILSSQLQTRCGSDKICVVERGTRVLVFGDVGVTLAWFCFFCVPFVYAWFGLDLF